jgi:hypothetical protein
MALLPMEKNNKIIKVVNLQLTDKSSTSLAANSGIVFTKQYTSSTYPYPSGYTQIGWNVCNCSAGYLVQATPVPSLYKINISIFNQTNNADNIGNINLNASFVKDEYKE